ncbi:MAG TPA: 2'-5' RNA ligase family protein, partial [Planctomycetota bacterium]|nr:2'-5' RNA ligase family protein [Planctomycetota bacterium]
PRTVWAGATGDLGKLAGLAAAVERAAEQVGVPREGRPFVAHVTLGRVRSLCDPGRFHALIDAQSRVPLGDDVVGEFVLFRSTLTPLGPVYEAIARFPLGADGRSIA